MSARSSLRISIPSNIRKICNINFDEKIRLYKKDNTLILSNSPDLDLPCFGIILLDQKFRFFLPKELRKLMNITTPDQVIVYELKGDTVIEKVK